MIMAVSQFKGYWDSMAGMGEEFLHNNSWCEGCVQQLPSLLQPTRKVCRELHRGLPRLMRGSAWTQGEDHTAVGMAPNGRQAAHSEGEGASLHEKLIGCEDG